MLSLIELRFGRVAGKGAETVVGDEIVRAVLTNQEESLQMGQCPAALGTVESPNRAQLVEVVDRSEAADRDERRGLALSQQIFDLVRAKGRIDGHENRPNLRQRELEHHPFGHVGRPNGDTVARRHARGHQPARDASRLVLELSEGVAKAGMAVDERFAIRQRLREESQEAANGHIAKGRLHVGIIGEGVVLNGGS